VVAIASTRGHRQACELDRQNATGQLSNGLAREYRNFPVLLKITHALHSGSAPVLLDGSIAGAQKASMTEQGTARKSTRN
jgi:hypothetical protein